MPPPDLIVILGPTATGKSEVAALLAARIGGDVIGADSIQVYRGLDAGSCKPSPLRRAAVPHHLIDVADPNEPFSAGAFARMALEAIAAVRAAGRVPIVAGGTGLYLRALLHGIAPMPPRDEPTRTRLYARAERSSAPALHEELVAIDPASAARIGPNDLQRIVRALEVAEITGVPLSRHIDLQRFETDRLPALKIGLSMDRALLDERIDGRVDGIFAAGIVEEVRSLLAAGVPARSNAFKALGYREVIAHLRGDRDLDGTVALVKRNTRRYARRQIRWFKAEPGVRWYDAGTLTPAAIAGVVADIHASRTGETQES